MMRDLSSFCPCVVWVVFQGVMVLADFGVWQLRGALESDRLNNRTLATMEYSIFRREVRPY